MNTDLLMDNIQASLTVTIVGMVTVMVFLTIMVWTTNLTQRIVNWLNIKFPVEVQEDTKTKKKTSGDEEDVAIAIASVLNFQAKL